MLVGCLAPSTNTRVVYESPSKLRLQDGSQNDIFRIENEKHANMLEQLNMIKEVDMQCYCHTRTAIPAASKPRLYGKRGGTLQRIWGLDIILYGPSELEEAMGQFLSQHRMYLQDPLHCDRNVPYRNPHIVPPEDGSILMTGSLNGPLGNLEIERLDAGPDLLAQLISDEVPLSETEGPDIVKTPLFKFVSPTVSSIWALEVGILTSRSAIKNKH